MGNSLEVCALQIGNTTPGRTAGADCTAVCGQPPDTRFFVNGNQVGECQSAVKSIFRHRQCFGVLDNRHGHRNPLVAAAGIDNHRQFAAAHARVGPGRRLGNGAVSHIVPIKFEHGRTDVGTVITQQAFLRNLGIVLNLGIQHRADVCRITGVGKVENIRDCQQVPVGQAVLCGIIAAAGRFAFCRGIVQQNVTVFLDKHNVCVIPANAHHRRIRAVIQCHDNIKDKAVVDGLHRNRDFFHKTAHIGQVLQSLSDAAIE